MAEFASGQRVRIGSRATLASVGVSGTAHVLPAVEAREPESRLPRALADAMEAAGLHDTRADFLLTVHATTPEQGAPHVVIERDLRPAEGRQWVALAVTVADDRFGLFSWHRFDPAWAGRLDIRRQEWAGPFGWAGKLLIKIFSFVIEDAAGAAAGQLALAFEERRHRYRLRAFAPGSYHHDVPADLPDPMWSELTCGDADRRTLLLLHGTFSRAHAAFGGLPPEVFARLHAAYGGRLIAFDHFTLVHDPAENVRRLISLIPDGSDLHFDVLTHSRGGLVARELSRQAATAAAGRRRLRIGAIVHVGTPNAGTALADPDRREQLINRMTTILSVFGGGSGVSDGLATVLELVKHLAAGALAELPGLTAMSPGSGYLRGLNAARPAGKITHFALGSDFEPTTFAMMVQDLAADTVFSGTNDLIVPADGVRDLGSSGTVAKGDSFVLTPQESVHHHAYFELPQSIGRIMSWLRPS
jgi:hypothetical protein